MVLCVIFISDKVRPTDEQVTLAYNQNDAGAGVAWRENGVVRWDKGLNLEEAKKYCRELPMPFIAHFRIPSGGFPKIDQLCHPFPIDKSAPLHTKGSTKGSVLFHNGHWNRWQECMLGAVERTGVKLPVGKWSDSRAMAFLTSIYGIGYLELIPDQKTCVFDANKPVEVTGVWAIIEPGFWASNRFWENKGTFHQTGSSRTMCLVSSCVKLKLYNSDYCFDHKKHFDDLDEKNRKAIAGAGSGGGSNVIPFVQAAKLYHEGKLSKNKFKKARRQWENEQEKARKKRMREAEEALRVEEMTVVH